MPRASSWRSLKYLVTCDGSLCNTRVLFLAKLVLAQFLFGDGRRRRRRHLLYRAAAATDGDGSAAVASLPISFH